MNNDIDFIDDLQWRGMLHNVTPNIEELFTNKPVGAYIGFDATADSLHVGHLMQILTLVHFQKSGHKPYVLVGGATSMVGDPSGKSKERKLLDVQTLAEYQIAIQKQLEKFMDFSPSLPNRAEVLNNYDWFENMPFLHFIRDVGKHISVNYMMAKDSVKSRFASDSGISFTEFCYQLLQGYDFYHLATQKKCLLQMGGSDQWGNIITGIEIIRRKSDLKPHALTTNLVQKNDGSKFGKTESGAVWLDPRKTSPYKFYQFWLNISDEDAVKFVKYFSLKPREEIVSLIAEHSKAPHRRSLQKSLAHELTALVHSTREADNARRTSEFLFSDQSIDFINTLTNAQIQELFDPTNTVHLPLSLLATSLGIVELLADNAKIVSSRSEVRRLIANKGVWLNKTAVASESLSVGSSHLLKDKFMIVQRGKKNYFLLDFS